MENTLLTRKANGEKILISELLAAPPSDEVLSELFPYSRNSKPHISQLGLKILKLRLDGKDNEEAGKELGLTRNQVEGRFQNIKAKFERGPIPDYIELDSPALRRLRGLEVTFTEGYMKLSELLRDMPSDQELKEFAIMRGNVPGFGTKRILNHEDLILVQKKQAGISVASLTAKARKAWRATQKVDGRDVIIDRRATEAAPWYVTADLNHYIDGHKKAYYEAVEAARVVQEFIDYAGPEKNGESPPAQHGLDQEVMLQELRPVVRGEALEPLIEIRRASLQLVEDGPDRSGPFIRQLENQLLPGALLGERQKYGPASFLGAHNEVHFPVSILCPFPDAGGPVHDGRQIRMNNPGFLPSLWLPLRLL